jgi:hypothetical protein
MLMNQTVPVSSSLTSSDGASSSSIRSSRSVKPSSELINSNDSPIILIPAFIAKIHAWIANTLVCVVLDTGGSRSMISQTLSRALDLDRRHANWNKGTHRLMETIYQQGFVQSSSPIPIDTTQDWLLLFRDANGGEETCTFRLLVVPQLAEDIIIAYPTLLKMGWIPGRKSQYFQLLDIQVPSIDLPDSQEISLFVVDEAKQSSLFDSADVVIIPTQLDPDRTDEIEPQDFLDVDLQLYHPADWDYPNHPMATEPSFIAKDSFSIQQVEEAISRDTLLPPNSYDIHSQEYADQIILFAQDNNLIGDAHPNGTPFSAQETASILALSFENFLIAFGFLELSTQQSMVCNSPSTRATIHRFCPNPTS